MDIIKFRDQTRARLIAQRGNYRQIVETSGLDYSWLSKFASAVIDNPTVTRLHTLAGALDAIEKGKAA